MGAIGDSSALTTAQLTTVAEIMVAGAFFSTLGSLVIITVFLNSPELRKSFAFQLVFGLALAELGNSFWPYFFMPREGAACECQAVLLQFFSFASIAWTGVIAWTLEMATNTERKPGGPSPSSVAAAVVGIGDPTRAREELGWAPKVVFEELVDIMVDADEELVRREVTLRDAGFTVGARDDD